VFGLSRVFSIASKHIIERNGIDQLLRYKQNPGIGGASRYGIWPGETNKAEEAEFLLIDAKNAFNEQNRTAMLWTVRHELKAGAKFTFNCYKHWSTLVIRDNDGMAPSSVKKGVTQKSLFQCLLTVSDYYHSFVLSSYSFQRWIRLGTRMMLVQAASSMQSSVFEKLEEIGPQYGYFPEAFEELPYRASEELFRGVDRV
jgi:hypothetical protein